MEFKNITKKVIYMYIDSVWIAIEPDTVWEIPEYIGLRQKGLSNKNEKPEKPLKESPEIPKEKKVLEKEAKPLKKLSEAELKKLTKDGLNDYAAKLGLLDEVNASMKKDEMIDIILSFHDEI